MGLLLASVPSCSLSLLLSFGKLTLAFIFAGLFECPGMSSLLLLIILSNVLRPLCTPHPPPRTPVHPFFVCGLVTLTQSLEEKS